jgi:hypothetical protein
MATAKVKVYPACHISINSKGKMQAPSFQLHSYLCEAKYSSEYDFFTFPIGDPIELEIEVPDGQEIDNKCLALLEGERGKVKTEHQVLLTKLKFLENQLLKLAAPEILDTENPVRPPDCDVSDVEDKRDPDIPC